MKTSVAILLILSLAGCGEGPDTNQTASGEALSNEAVAKAMDSVKLKPGTWETTVEVKDIKLIGFPSSVPVAQQEKLMREQMQSAGGIRYCVTPEEAAKPSAKFFAAQEGSDCTASQLDIAGGNVNVRMECSGASIPGNTVATMKGTYLADRYDIGMDMQTSGLPNDGQIHIVARNVGKWISDECTETPPAAAPAAK